MRRILTLAVAILLIAWMFAQCRKPTGPLGRVYLWLMNRSHSAMTDWGLAQATINSGDAILDVGCGGGRTIQKLAARAPAGRVTGLDYSAASVKASSATNADAVADGRVSVHLGSVAAMPFPDRRFDLVTAVETHYYWPDLPANMREVLRVLKPGGRLVVIAETSREGVLGALYAVPMRLLRAAHLSDAEHRDLLTQAGFTDVITRRKLSWIAASGRRPAA
jgi:ubiquinone/menaquinone biosynthesis C-methylase UbiE